MRSEKLKNLTIDGKGSYGIGASAVPYSKSLYRYLRITDINDDGTIDESKKVSLDEGNADEYLLKKNDIVFARTGASTGRSYFYNESDREMVYAGFLIKFSLDNEKVNPKYVKYYTQSKDFKSWVDGIGTGSTRPNINAVMYGDLQVPLPLRQQQNLLVDTLSCLDAKIELNNKIGKNLEAQAQAIFKSWFIDFEPFQDGEFVESELGLIPKGWRVVPIEDKYTVAIGKTPPRKEPHWFSSDDEDIVWLSIANMSNNNVYVYNSTEYLTGAAIERHNVRIIPKGSVLLSFKLTVGRVAITDVKMTTNEAIAHFIPECAEEREYLYLYLSQFQYEKLGSTSSIGKAINSKIVKKMPYLAPDVKTIKEFNHIIFPIFQMIKQNQYQSTTLAALRDLLLPKLMSGQLTIPTETH